ncbi:MAG TPA: protein translocase subunit SecF [Dermatophilaceae bacterium]|nr:protein translocase subunit SecF [Dermatophilaceae bacterium]
MSFADFGNDLYTGRRSVPVVPLRRRFYLASLIVMLIALSGLGIRGLNLGLEFRGGSEFRVTGAGAPSGYEATAREAVGVAEDGRGVNVTRLGSGTVRVQTERLDDAESASVRTALAQAFDVPPADVSATFIGPSWGASVSTQALRALVIFLVLVALVMALYFRTWTMAAAALIALAHDMVITVGIYAWTGFEVSPATMIGFLTVLGYSLYDTVVVFDKVRENTNEAFANGRSTFAGAANLAVNQTFVRSINTTVVGILPIFAVLVVGAVWLGPGTLLDLSLVLFIGIVVGAYSSIFIATPLLVTLRSREARVLELDKRAARHAARTAKDARAAGGSSAGSRLPAEPGQDGALAAVGAGVDGHEGPEDVAAEGLLTDDSTLTGRAVHRYARSSGPRNQPRRTSKAKRG